ncbi:MAG: Hsp70 family protein, partial [Oscillospiraceae bacterium]|nr:Hsp70 family protein [Oscillospiraceae bacterium]
KRKEEVDTRNQADQMVYQTEKTLSEMGDKLDAADKASIEAEVNKVKEALKGTDTAAIKAATESLTQAFYKVSEKLYSQAAPQGGANPGAGFGGQQPGGDQGGNPGGGDYYDADYKVVDDDNNK